LLANNLYGTVSSMILYRPYMRRSSSQPVGAMIAATVAATIACFLVCM